MPDTIARNQIEDRWHATEKPALVMLKRRALELLRECDNIIAHKDLGYYAQPNDELRDYAATVADATQTLLSNLHFLARSEADNADLDPDLMTFDMSDIAEEVERWNP